MPYDAFLVSKLVREIKTPVYLTGIHDGPNGIVVLSLRRKELVVDTRIWPHLHTAVDYKFNDGTPSSFVSLLRARLKGATLIGVEQLNFDRVVRFRFEVRNLIGEAEFFDLYHEVTGAFGNLVLVKDGICLDAYKEVVSKSRKIVHGADYAPPIENRADPHALSDGIFDEPSERLSRLLVRRIRGLSKKSAVEVTKKARISFDTLVGTLTAEEKERILQVVRELTDSLEDGGAYVTVNPDGTPADVYAFRPQGEFRKFESASEAIEYFLSTRTVHLTIESKKLSLLKRVRHVLDKTEDTLRKVIREIRDAEGADEFKRYGQLLIANLHALPKKAPKVEVEDWETGAAVTIKLDPKTDISKNAQRFFDIYNNLKRKIEGAKERKDVLEKRLTYLHEIVYETENVSELAELDDIESELVVSGLFPSRKKKTRGKQKKQSLHLVYEYEGFRIMAGKNNIQNDRITMKLASHEDLWFHAREIPGSHVVVSTGGRVPPQEVVEMAASLAAGHSRYRTAEWVDVDYTKVRYVSKPKGARPGFVIYKNFKTITVRPRFDLNGVDSVG